MKMKSKGFRPSVTLSVLRQLDVMCDSGDAQRALLATKRSILKKLVGRIRGKAKCA
jgi:hypothetical protein